MKTKVVYGKCPKCGAKPNEPCSAGKRRKPMKNVIHNARPFTIEFGK